MRLLYQPADLDRINRWGSLFTLTLEDEAALGADEFYLRFNGSQLVLHKSGDPLGVSIDARDLERRRRGRLALAQACGDSAAGSRVVLDATAGFGTDLLTLHSRGYRVSGIEQHPVLYALLESHLLARQMNEVELELGDATTLLEAGDAGRYDVIYLDPMFPARSKTALPGKRLQYLRELIGEEPADFPALLDVARARAGERVVLKRRLRDPVLGQPGWQIRGRSVRYDVYRPQR